MNWRVRPWRKRELNTEANYLHDLGFILRELTLEATQQAAAARGTDAEEWQSGRSMAYWEVISLMQQQAEAFGLPFDQLAIDGLDPL